VHGEIDAVIGDPALGIVVGADLRRAIPGADLAFRSRAGSLPGRRSSCRESGSEAPTSP
jgi:hypothetical protein